MHFTTVEAIALDRCQAVFGLSSVASNYPKQKSEQQRNAL